MKDISFLTSIFDNCPWAASIIKVDLDDKGEPFDFTLLYANKLLAQLENKSLSDIVDKGFYSTNPKADKKWLNYYYEAVSQNNVIDLDEITLEANLFLHVTIIPTNLENICVCVLRDIKQETFEKEAHQKRLRDALVAAEKEKNYLNALCFDYTNLYYIDFETGEFEVLKSWTKTNGESLISEGKYKKFDELRDSYCDKYVIDSDKERVRSIITVENMRCELSKHNDVLFHYESFPNPNGKRFFEGRFMKIDNDVNGCLLAFRYIDDIMLAEKQTQDKLQKALDAANLSNEIISAIAKVYVSIYRIDLNLDHFDEISSNGDMHYLTGVSGVASVKLMEICDKYSKEEYKDRVKEFLDISTLKDRLLNDETVGLEFKTVDNTWLFARFIVKKRDSNNIPSNVLCVIRNISDQKREEEFWAIKAENERRANEAKSDFLSIISHDIRTPVNAISGFSELGINEVDNKEKTVDNFRKIKSASNYLTSIINNVLDMTSIERNAIVSHKDNISISEYANDLNKVVNSVVINSNNQNREIKVHDILCDTISVDSIRLKQIVFNLFNNACIYTPKNGNVTIEIYQKDLIDNHVKLFIEVKDTGVGMSDDFQKVMFEKYSREVDTRLSQVRGLGMGLNIVKKYTDMLGGKISVVSKKNKGTTFRVEFDVECTNCDKKENENKECNNVPLKDLKVLVAEDNDLNYEIVEGLIKVNEGLNFNKITVDRAKDGKEAVEMIEKDNNYNCILMDVQMPVMDGYEATRKIRELERNGGSNRDSNRIRTRIFAVTANAFEKDKQACLDAGMDDYLSKPVDSNKLLELLKSCV